MIGYDKEIRLKFNKFTGYMYFCDRKHPLAMSNGIVYYHRHIASMKAGRWINGDEHVHHVDGNRLNNDPCNLDILSPCEHARIGISQCGAMFLHLIRRSSAKSKKEKECLWCKSLTRNKKFCSIECRASFGEINSRKPSCEQLRSDIDCMTWVAIGKKYGVTDNAVKRWARKYGLL